METNWASFFLGENALQNYMSEFIGILLMVLLIDRLIQYRERKRNRPLKDMGSVLIYELVDSFIDRYLPKQYNRNGASSRLFGNYYASGGVYSFEETSVPLDEIAQQIKKSESIRWEMINWPWEHGLTEDARRSEEAKLEQVLDDLRQYGRDIEDFLLKHQALLDGDVVQRLSAIRFEIATAFKTFYEQLRQYHSSPFGVDMRRLLPKLVIESIQFNRHLAECYGHKWRVRRRLDRPDRVEPPNLALAHGRPAWPAAGEAQDVNGRS